MLSPADVASLGFDLSLVGVTALQAYIATLQKTATSLVTTGTATTLAPFAEVKRVVGFDELLAFTGPAPTLGIPSTERPNRAHWSGGLVGPS